MWVVIVILAIVMLVIVLFGIGIAFLLLMIFSELELGMAIIAGAIYSVGIITLVSKLFSTLAEQDEKEKSLLLRKSFWESQRLTRKKRRK